MASIDGDALTTNDDYRAAVVDLLGVLAYGELMAFERLAADAALAPTIDDEAQLAGMAAAEFRHFSRLRDRLVEIGADPAVAMQPFRAPLERFHEMTAPSDWLEGLVKAYVGDGIGVDFYREIATYLDPQTQALVLEVCEDLGQSAFVVDRVRAAIAALREQGQTVVCALPGHDHQVDEFHCDRELVPDAMHAGSWTVRNL